VLGILSIKELFIAIPQLISTILTFFQGYSISGGLLMIVISLLTVAVVLWIAYTLIYKADSLVTKFGLDQNFTESTLNLNISGSSVLRIAIIVTGALLVISEIPEFCRIMYSLLQQQNLSYFQDGSPDWSRAVVSGVKIVIALLIIGERKRILQFLEKSPSAEQNENV